MDPPFCVIHGSFEATSDIGAEGVAQAVLARGNIQPLSQLFKLPGITVQGLRSHLALHSAIWGEPLFQSRADFHQPTLPGFALGRADFNVADNAEHPALIEPQRFLQPQPGQ